MATVSSTNKTPSDNIDKAIHSLEATKKKLDQIIAMMKSSSCGNPNVGPVSTFASCKEIFDNRKARGNRAYTLQMHSGKVPVYCHMTNHGLGACGGGGWTLVMKIDGNKRTFHFKSKLWSNKVNFHLPGGKTLFDNHETKLPTYWNTPFSKICLGMKIGHQVKFIIVPRKASSLYSLIADGQYRSTSLGRNTWKMLIGSQASLQPNCNKEGFNTAWTYTGNLPIRAARIGILGNEQNDCATTDSRIGFGTGGGHDDSNACGNEAKYGGDNGDKHIKAMGYILVQ